MKTKLTLTVDRDTIQKAKAYAGKSSNSLSALIENFLKSLARKNAKLSAVDASKGLLKGKFSSMIDKEIRKEYYRNKHGV